jgi:exonuclease III
MPLSTPSHDGTSVHPSVDGVSPQKPIRIASYNICSARGGSLESVLRALDQMNVDFCLLQETKLSDDRYTKFSSGYRVFATKATNPFQGGVALVYRQSPYWQIESERVHSPNVISFELVTGCRRTLVIGAYIPPGDRNAIEFIEQAAQRCPNLPIMLMGDLNVDLLNLRDTRDANLAAMVATLGLLDILEHFYMRSGFGHCNTWFQTREHSMISSRCDYILSSDRCLFRNMQLKKPRLFTSDHYLILGEFLSEPLRENRRYLGGRRRFPLHATAPVLEVEKLFADIQAACADPIPPERPPRPSWISSETWNFNLIFPTLSLLVLIVAFEKPFGQIESGERKWQAKPLKLILLAAI